MPWSRYPRPSALDEKLMLVVSITFNTTLDLKHLSTVGNSEYILNQPVHHCKVSFAEEYDFFVKHYQQSLRWELK
jgi:hypothetical protein